MESAAQGLGLHISSGNGLYVNLLTKYVLLMCNPSPCAALSISLKSNGLLSFDRVEEEAYPSDSRRGLLE